MFEAPLVLSFVSIGELISTSRLFPHAFPFLQAINEEPEVRIAIEPLVLTVTVCLAIRVLTKESVSVGEDIRALSVPEIELPLAFISVPIGPLILPVPVNLVLYPLAKITFASGALPGSIAVLGSVLPAPVI